MKTSESKSEAIRVTAPDRASSRVEPPAVQHDRDSGSLLHLQRVVGNQAVSRLMAGQTIRVGAPDHPLEQEARRTAESIGTTPLPQATQPSTDGGRQLSQSEQ